MLSIVGRRACPKGVERKSLGRSKVDVNSQLKQRTLNSGRAFDKTGYSSASEKPDAIAGE